MPTVHCRRPAMACWFEAWLAGPDAIHLEAVGAAVMDEVERLERLLSRHDRASELARINREARHGWVKVSVELFQVLKDLMQWHEETDGAFDIGAAASTPSTRPLPERLHLDPDQRAVAFADDGLQLDLGGYGKGYALDAAARLASRFGVVNLLMHGGTSSILARGSQEDGRPWMIAVGNPFYPAGAQKPPLAEIRLRDESLSTSAVFYAGSMESDVVDPATATRLNRRDACVVIAPTASQAESVSTAMLVMGPSLARAFWARRNASALRAAWIEGDESGLARLEWLHGGAPP